MTSTAHAEPPGLTPPIVDPIETETVPGYRVETALVDGAVVGLGLLTIRDGSNGGWALAGYLLGGPVVHLLNDHAERAGASFVLRLGLPLAGLVIGSVIGNRQCDVYCDDDAELGDALLGVALGMVAASAIDIGYLSSETVTQRRRSFQPTFSTGPNNAVHIGIGGAF